MEQMEQMFHFDNKWNKFIWILPELLGQAQAALRNELSQSNAHYSWFLASNNIFLFKNI